MSSLPSENQPIAKNTEELDQQEESDQLVSSHLYLKPAHATGTLNKAVVLRRIRHRKRVNRVKSAVQTLLGSPFASAADQNKSSATRIRWVDDAFAAP